MALFRYGFTIQNNPQMGSENGADDSLPSISAFFFQVKKALL